ncbi:hypothetical protein DM02DRAFT_730189 [Periconia macrospinosa]|uniref:Uncharacterized protein n=1 Tax=Periconia macrospinosa TaxID=97972 RepID=A0A2V1DJC4_9PLEO|nr:hypothetical protein DM02DRAFT_730189 [Periconia macrospinosa]
MLHFSGNKKSHSSGTRQQILQWLVDASEIYRLWKEHKRRQGAPEPPSQRRYTPNKAKTRAHKNSRRIRRSPSPKQNMGVDPDPDETNPDDDSLVSGKTNVDNDDPRYMMSGAIQNDSVHSSGSDHADALPPISHPAPPSPSWQTPTKSKERTCQPGKRKQRHNSQGESLVRGRRGWLDTPVGPPPTYVFKLDATLGYGTHVRNWMEWNKRDYERRQRKKERRARGTLEERKQARQTREWGEIAKGKDKPHGKETREQTVSGKPHGSEEFRESNKVSNQMSEKHERRGRARLRKPLSSPSSASATSSSSPSHNEQALVLAHFARQPKHSPLTRKKNHPCLI